MAFKPDVTIIHLGLNDTDPRNWPNYRNSFSSDYAALIDSIRAVNRDMQIYICRLTPIFSGHPRFLSGTRAWYDQIQALLPQIAASNQVGLIDLHTPLHTRIDLFDDYLHPNRQGAAIIARQVANILRPLNRTCKWLKRSVRIWYSNVTGKIVFMVRELQQLR
ncbi:GDSL-type esterase/lipase family protein [Sphingobacterium sp. E70]|uniref:GDSL-type esterase/lipase family protein n=1 Tax=Sphingobacterium sp. E70 TaxID=2853439 RepID=UPI00359C1E0E